MVKKVTDFVVTRFKLFCFYSLMALVSVYNPRLGLEMIEAAENGVQ